MTVDLKERLEQLDLFQYYESFVAEGFDTWTILLDITESDLNCLNVKLGHRRKLQRAITDSRGNYEASLRNYCSKPASIEGSLRSDESGTEGRPRKRAERGGLPSGPGTKRRYRRHPKPDANAPERPASAYVIFSNQMREELKGQVLSFTEIAKIVGERWQVLQPEIREGYERQAAAAKEKYYAELAEYKKTPEYTQYQEYLADFRAKHTHTTTDARRSKIEAETSISTHSSGNDADRMSTRFGSSLPNGFAASDSRSPSSPSAPCSALSGHEQFSKPTSMSTSAYCFPGVNSPQPQERYSPMSASPISGSAPRDVSGEYRQRRRAVAQEASERYSDPTLSTLTSSLPSQGYSTAEPPRPGPTPHQSDPPNVSRRSRRDSFTLPRLTHEDTSLSSDAGYPPGPVPVVQYQIDPLLAQDAAKQHPHRVLPQPVPTGATAPFQLEHRTHATSPTEAPVDYRYGSSLAALVRAGELARDSDGQ